MYYDQEILIGKIGVDFEIKYTKTGKMIGNSYLENENENLLLIAWEEIAEKIRNEIRKGCLSELKGYRKFNDFIKKEQFVIKEFKLL